MARESSPILGVVRTVVGRRRIISRREMHDLLTMLGDRGMVAPNGWCPPLNGDPWARWAHACRDITVISLFDAEASPEARLASSNPGTIRYDEPGSIHPLLHATVMFVPATLRRYSATIDYLREHGRRVLLVRQPAET